MRESNKLELDGKVYIIGDWPVDKSLKVLVWLTKTFGESLAGIFMTEEGFETLDNLQSDEKVSESTKTAIADFVTKLLSNLDEDQYVKYCKLICEGVKVDGKDLNFNLHFVGKIGTLHTLLFNVLQQQYRDFFSGKSDEG